MSLSFCLQLQWWTQKALRQTQIGRWVWYEYDMSLEDEYDMNWSDGGLIHRFHQFHRFHRFHHGSMVDHGHWRLAWNVSSSGPNGGTAERRARRTCPEAIPCPRRVSHGWYHERNGSFFLCILMQFAQIFWYFFDLKSCTAGVPSVVPRLAVDAVFDFGDPNVAEASVHRRFFSGCNRYPLVI